MGSCIIPPEPLKIEHDLQNFDCGHEDLNHWLKKRALKNQDADATKTYVITIQNKVTGYYSLATGGIVHALAPGSVRRNMPDPVPVMILGRLAVDHRSHHQGIGRGLLRDAARRTLRVASIAGVRAMLVHAISEEAKNFYTKFGFELSPVDPMTLMVNVKELRKSFLYSEGEISKQAVG
jgi:GNAT superfamily N-acetyltransferase